MSRVKMPHGNRVSGSAALKTNDIWSKTIGYDPYANSSETKNEADIEAQRASLMLLARMSNLSGSESRGGCKKCGLLGHLAFQCRNVPLKKESPTDEADSDSDSSSSIEEAIPKKKEATTRARESEKEQKQEKKKRARVDSSSSSSSDDDDDSDDDDSDDSHAKKKKRKHKKHKKSSKKHSKKEHKKKSKREKKNKL
ncbi:hypothetical protein EON65_44945 [archaeon]|nr:MAG: hypothetical protein EON65_44945 [archaeon]